MGQVSAQEKKRRHQVIAKVTSAGVPRGAPMPRKRGRPSRPFPFLTSVSFMGLVLGLSLSALSSAKPALAQQGETIADAWTLSTAHCAAGRTDCAFLAERTESASQALTDWVAATARVIARTDSVTVDPLTEQSFQTADEPEAVIRRRLDRLQRDALQETTRWRDVSARLTETGDALDGILSNLGQRLRGSAGVIADMNARALGSQARARPTLAALSNRQFLDADAVAQIRQIDEILEEAGELPSNVDGRRMGRTLTDLRSRMDTVLDGLFDLAGTLDWDRRSYTADYALLLGIRKLLAAHQILYGVELERFALLDENLPQSDGLRQLGRLGAVLTRIEQRADWDGQMAAISETHRALANSLDTIIEFHGARSLRRGLDLSDPGASQRRRPVLCLTDATRKFTAYLDADLTARPLNGVYGVSFNPGRSQARLESKHDQRCYGAGDLTEIDISLPVQMVEAVLAINLFVSVRTAQLNWHAAQLGFVQTLPALAADIRRDANQLRRVLNNEPIAIAERGNRIGCGMTREIEFQDTGRVVFDVQVKENGSPQLIEVRGEVPRGFNQDRFARQMVRVLECERYDARTINGDTVQHWTTIELDIQ